MVYVELPISDQVCPCCRTSTSKVHDHYTHPIKDIPIQFKPTTIFLKKAKYECKNCGKSFYQQNDFIAKYKRKYFKHSRYLLLYKIHKIKALKRTTFGMTKFENFKTRIMLLN